MKPVGVFETFRSYPGGLCWRFDEHWSRWERSAELCGFALPVDKSIVENMITEVLSGSSELRLRLWSDGQDWELEVSPLPEGPTEISICDQVFARTNPQAKHDKHDYAQFFDKNFFETIWFDEQDVLLEGNITNVFVVIDGQLCTPRLDNILPGLMRAWVINNFQVIERDINRGEMWQAEEIILTNMVRGIVSVDKWGEWESQANNTAEKLRTNMTCQITSAP